MNDLAILAASYLGPEGFGNDRTGLRPYPPSLKQRLDRGELECLHWSLISDSDPSRFARMDLMCRLGVLAAELLEAGFDGMPETRRDRIGVCVESFTGSLDTDVRFLQTPRPSLFAYTLPSTVVGEICIRYRLKGPILSLVSPEPGASQVLTEATEWIGQDDAEACLCLTCEALDGAIAPLLPETLRLPGWFAGALLLGRQTGSGREIPPAEGTLGEICRRVVGTELRS